MAMISRVKSPAKRSAFDHVMPRHAPFYIALAVGVLSFGAGLLITPKFAVSIGANAMFVVFLTITALKMKHLTAAYLKDHARDEDAPAYGIFVVALVVLTASVAGLFMALNGDNPDVAEVGASVASVLLGWFTAHTVWALHYAYEYYQVPQREAGKKGSVIGGLDFPGEDEPDGTAFIYYSYTVGTSVATSDTKVTNNAMRRRVVVHIVFSHFFNTAILAATVNVVMALGGM